MILTQLLPAVQLLSAQDKFKLIRILAEELNIPIGDDSLTELLDGITQDNLHREIKVSTAVGNELW